MTVTMETTKATIVEKLTVILILKLANISDKVPLGPISATESDRE